MFDSITIAENKIKSISIIRYDHEVRRTQKYRYTFNKSSQLICSEIQFFHPNDTLDPIQQTLDCFEYSDQGLQIKHKRYHDDRNSAEWVQEFSYEFNEVGLISKVIVKDISHPANSNETLKYYNSDDRLVKEITDYDYLSEYKYDQKGNIIEETGGSMDQQNRTVFKYDSSGNRIKMEYHGLSMDNYDIIEWSRVYDESNRRTKQEEKNKRGERSNQLYYYSGNNLIRTEYFDQDDNPKGVEDRVYDGSLLKTIIYKSVDRMIYKETFDYVLY